MCNFELAHMFVLVLENYSGSQQGLLRIMCVLFSDSVLDKSITQFRGDKSHAFVHHHDLFVVFIAVRPMAVCFQCENLCLVFIRLQLWCCLVENV